jgi:hypothetical protein
LEEDIFELEDGAARSWLGVPDFRSEEFILISTFQFVIDFDIPVFC